MRNSLKMAVVLAGCGVVGACSGWLIDRLAYVPPQPVPAEVSATVPPPPPASPTPAQRPPGSTSPVDTSPWTRPMTHRFFGIQ